MGKRTGGGGPTSQKSKGPPRWWCYYCDTRHEGELQLIQHQRHKHFLCRFCDPKSYGRNCLSLGGLVSHVRRSHRTEITEVPGAIDGRKSLDVEVSGMNGIPQNALDAFEEKLAEESLASYGGGHAAPPSDSEDEEEPYQPPPPDELNAVDDKKDDPANPLLSGPLGIPDLQWVSNMLASQDGQYASLKKTPSIAALPSRSVKAFDPSILAARLSGASVPEITPDTIEMHKREEEEAKKREEKKEREKKEEEKKRKQVSIAFLPKDLPKLAPPPVPQADKKVVADLGFELAARAQEAAMAMKANTQVKKGEVNLKTRLAAMQQGGLLKFAVDAGVEKADIMKAKGAKDYLIQLILQLETEETWTTLTFKPGKIGLRADWARGEVESVTPGEQGDMLGVKVGWIFKTVSGEKFNKNVLMSKMGGVNDYKVVFATDPVATDRSRNSGGGRFDPGGVRRKRQIIIQPADLPQEATGKDRRRRGPDGEEEREEYNPEEDIIPPIEEGAGRQADGGRRFQERRGGREYEDDGRRDDYDDRRGNRGRGGRRDREREADYDDGGRDRKRHKSSRDHEPEYDDRRYEEEEEYEYEDEDYEDERYERRGDRHRDDREKQRDRHDGREKEKEAAPREKEAAPRKDDGRKRGVDRLLPRDKA